MKKFHISLIIGNLVGDKQLLGLSLIRNFIANLVKVLDIIKEFARNRVNELGNIPFRCVVPKFSGLEVIALPTTAEALCIGGRPWRGFVRKRLSTTLKITCKGLHDLYQSTVFAVQTNGYTILCSHLHAYSGGHIHRAILIFPL